MFCGLPFGPFPRLREAGPPAARASCDRKLHSPQTLGSDVSCGLPLPGRSRERLEELERILNGFDALPSAAQEAVGSVVESLGHDPDTSDAEIGHLNALLAPHGPRSVDGRHQRWASRAHKRTQSAHRIALTLSHSS